jgi:hypothetical protein
MAKHLDDMVNILRALIMDPAPDVQVIINFIIEISMLSPNTVL